jgi:hypothetical protein
MVLLMEFRSVQGMERLRPQQDGMVELLVVVVGGGDSLFCVVLDKGIREKTQNL